MSDLLAIPLVLEVQSCEDADGSWTRRLSYRGLDGCVVTASDLWEGIELLERKRWQLLHSGAAAPGGDRLPLRSGAFSYALTDPSEKAES